MDNEPEMEVFENQEGVIRRKVWRWGNIEGQEVMYYHAKKCQVGSFQVDGSEKVAMSNREDLQLLPCSVIGGQGENQPLLERTVWGSSAKFPL